jgi:hypothetical protein
MKAAADDKVKAKQAAKGKNSIMNGRALFSYQPDLFKDDENAVDEKLVKADVEESKVDDQLFAGEAVDEDEEVDFD